MKDIDEIKKVDETKELLKKNSKSAQKSLESNKNSRMKSCTVPMDMDKNQMNIIKIRESYPKRVILNIY